MRENTRRWWGLVLVLTISASGKVRANEELPTASERWAATLRWTLNHDHGVMALSFSPDGKQLLTSARLTYRLWDLSTGREVQKYVGTKARHLIRDIAWSPNGKHALLAAGQYKGTQRLKLWDAENWTDVREFPDHESPVTRVAFSADGRRAIAGTIAGDVFAWEVQTGERISHYKPKVGEWNGNPDSETRSLDISPDGKSGLWAGGRDNYQLRLFDITTGRELKSFVPKEPSRQAIVDAVFTRDGSQILAAHSYGFVRIWDIEQATSSKALRLSPKVITSVAFSKDDRLALVGGYAGELTLWRIADAQQDDSGSGWLLELQTSHDRSKLANAMGQASAGIIRVALSPDSQYAAAADHDGTVRIWEIHQRGPTNE